MFRSHQLKLVASLVFLSSISFGMPAQARLIALMDNDGVFQGGTAKIVSKGSEYLFTQFNDSHRQGEEEALPLLPEDFVPRQYVHKEYAEHLAMHDIEDCFCHRGEFTRISDHLGTRFTDEMFGINVHHAEDFSSPDDFFHEPYAIEGGVEFLDYLNTREVPWALVSNGYENFAIRAWHSTGLMDKRNNAPIVFPEHLETLEDSKPSPRHLENALHQLAVDDDEEVTLFMLGDSMGSDMTAAYGLAKNHKNYKVHAIYFTKEHPQTKKIDKEIAQLATWESEQENFTSVVCDSFDQVREYVDTLEA